MSANLLQMAQGAIGGPIMDQVSSMLGEDRDKTETAINGSLPAILGGMMQTADSPGGMANINRAADEADGSIFDNLGSMLSGNSGMLTTLGAPLLGLLFGGKQNGLIDAISRVAGIGSGSAGSLLKMLAPVIMSLLGRQKQQQGLDEGGLHRLLMEQRDPVAKAMPPEVSSAIGFGDFLDRPVAPTDAPASSAEATATAAPHTTTSTASASHETSADSGGGGGMMKWLLPLIVVLGLAWVGYTYFLAPDAPETQAENSPVQIQATANQALSGVATAVAGVTDEASANEAVERINAARETLDGVALDKIEGAQGFLGKFVERIESALESAYEIDGVQAIIEPAITPLLEKLKGIGS